MIVGEAQDIAGSTPATGTNQEPGIRNPESGIRNPEPAISNQAPVPSIDNIGTKFAPPQVRAVPVIPDSPLGVMDSLDFLNEMPIAIGRSGTGGELDWQETASIPKYYRPFIASEQGQPIDTVAQAAYEANLIPQPTADALMQRVQQDIGARRTYRVEGRKQTRDLLTREKQEVSFDKSQNKLERQPNAQPVPTDALVTGDRMTIDGEEVIVRAVESDEDGYPTKVVLEDGKRFGVQEFNPQTKTGLFVDEFQPRARAEGSTEGPFSKAGPQRSASQSAPGGLTEAEAKRWRKINDLAEKYNLDLSAEDHPFDDWREVWRNLRNARSWLEEAARYRRGETKVSPGAIERFAKEQSGYATNAISDAEKSAVTALAKSGQMPKPRLGFRLLGKVTKTPWGSRYYHFDYKGQWWYVRVADHANTANRAGIDDNTQGRYYTTSGMSHPQRLNIVLDEPASSDAVALAYAKKGVEAALEQFGLTKDDADNYYQPVLRGKDGDITFDNPEYLQEQLAESRNEKAQSTPLTGQAGESRLDVRGRGPSKTEQADTPPSPPAVNDNLTESKAGPQRGLGRGLGALLGTPGAAATPAPAPASQRPATTLTRTMIDQVRALLPAAQRPVGMEEMLSRAENILKNDGNFEVRQTDPTTVPQALQLILSGANPTAIVNRWAEHRNQAVMGQTTAPTPFTETAATNASSPRESVMSAYAQLDRTGQGYVRIPDLARASGLPMADVREVLIDLSDRGAAYLTPADEPRNIPPADRSMLVVGPSGLSLYVTMTKQRNASRGAPRPPVPMTAKVSTTLVSGSGMDRLRNRITEAVKAVQDLWQVALPGNTRSLMFAKYPFSGDRVNGDIDHQTFEIRIKDQDSRVKTHGAVYHELGHAFHFIANRQLGRDTHDNRIIQPLLNYLRTTKSGATLELAAADVQSDIDGRLRTIAKQEKALARWQADPRPTTQKGPAPVVPKELVLNEVNKHLLYLQEPHEQFARAVHAATLFLTGEPVNAHADPGWEEVMSFDEAETQRILTHVRAVFTQHLPAASAANAQLQSGGLPLPAPAGRTTGNTDDLGRINGRPGQAPGPETRAASQGAPESAAVDDAAYLAAVEAGDMETAQRMVDEAAKAAGYSTKDFWRSVKRDGERGELLSRENSYVTDSVDAARDYKQGLNYALHRVYIKKANVLRVDNIGELKDALPEEDFNSDGYLFEELDRQSIRDAVWDLGYDTVRFSDISQDNSREHDSWLLKDSGAIKSAMPVTRDESGQVIPLSQRFNPADDRITRSQSAPVKPSQMFLGSVQAQDARDNLASELRARKDQLTSQEHPNAIKQSQHQLESLAKQAERGTLNTALHLTRATPAIYFPDYNLHKHSYDRSADEVLKLGREALASKAGKTYLAIHERDTTTLSHWQHASRARQYVRDVSGGRDASRSIAFLSAKQAKVQRVYNRIEREKAGISEEKVSHLLEGGFRDSLASAPLKQTITQRGVPAEKIGTQRVQSQSAPPLKPSRAVPLREEFGGAFPGHVAFTNKAMTAWAEQTAAGMTAAQIETAAATGRYDHVQLPYILTQGLLKSEREVRTAKTQAERTRAQATLGRLRDQLNPQNSDAGQALVAQKLALAPMREMMPSLAVDEAVEKGQTAVIDPAVGGSVQPAVKGLQDLTNQASAEATDELTSELEAEDLDLEPEPSTPAEQSRADEEMIRLRQELTAGKNALTFLTATWQKILATFTAAGQNKGAMVKDQKARMAARLAARKAAGSVAGNRVQSRGAPAVGVTQPALPATAVEDGMFVIIDKGIDFDTWQTEMVKLLGAKFAPQINVDLFGKSVAAYEKDLAVSLANVKTRVKAKATKQGKGKQGPAAKVISARFPNLGKMLSQLRPMIAPGLNWKQIFTSTATQQRQWELDTYAAIRQHPALQSLNAEQAKNLTRELSKTWQSKRRTVWKRELNRTLIAAGMAKPKVRAKIEASAPRLLALINLGALDARTFRDAVAKEFGLRSMNDAEVGKIKEAAEKLQGLAPGTVPYRKAAQKFMEGLESLTNLSRAQLLESWWTASVLSGWRTQMDILFGVSNAMEDIGIGAVVGAIRTGNYGVASRAIFATIERAIQAVPEAFQMVVTGNRSLQASFDAEIRAHLEEGYPMMGQAGRQLMAKGGWRTGFGAFQVAMGRIMSALDHITSSGSRAGALWLARANHPEIFAAALNITAQDRANARKQALQILTGGAEPTTTQLKQEVKRYTQELLDARHTLPDIEQQASDVGLQSSLQSDPTGLGFLAYELMRAVPQKADTLADRAAKDNWVPIAVKLLRMGGQFSRVLFGTKFIRTAGNAITRATNYVPGIGALNLMDGRSKIGSPAGDIILGKQMLGLVLFSGLLYAFRDREEEDDMGIEGGWKNLNADQRGQLLNQGKQPYSVWGRNAKGQIVSWNYQQWSIANLLAAVGFTQDQRRYHGVDADAATVAQGLGYGLMTIADKAQLQGISTILGRDNNRSSGADTVKGLNEWAAGLVGGMSPRLVKDIEDVIKPQLPRTDYWWQAWAREVPILRSQSSGARVDIFGREITIDRKPLSRIYQTGTVEPEYQILAKLNQRDVWISDPTLHPRKVKLSTGSRDMLPLEKDRYAREAGKMTKDWLLQTGPQLLQMEPEQAQKMISQRTELIRAMALNRAVRR